MKNLPPFLGLQAFFRQEERSLVKEPSRLTNECMGVVKVINYLRMCQRSFCGHSLHIEFNRPFPFIEATLACETM